ncbi:MAG TPA: ribonuclease P protein component [Chloroflexota bacterium]|nr:ribonuclease P protein component [Chloroflexota bacterium]
MLSKPNRLTNKRDFDRVFAAERATYHPLCTLRAARNELSVSRFGIVCGKRVGGAVVRNRVRRRLRHQVRRLLVDTAPGWDILLVGQPKAAQAASAELYDALKEVLRRRGVLTRAELI